MYSSSSSSSDASLEGGFSFSGLALGGIGVFLEGVGVITFLAGVLGVFLKDFCCLAVFLGVLTYINVSYIAKYV